MYKGFKALFLSISGIICISCVGVSDKDNTARVVDSLNTRNEFIEHMQLTVIQECDSLLLFNRDSESTIQYVSEQLDYLLEITEEYQMNKRIINQSVK